MARVIFGLRDWTLKSSALKNSSTSICKIRMAGHNQKSSRGASVGVVLGIHSAGDGTDFKLTPNGKSFEKARQSHLSELILTSGLADKKGKVRVFYGFDKDFPAVAVAMIGKESAGFNHAEDIDEAKENIRQAVAAGVRQLNEAGVKKIFVDPCGDAEAAAEGSVLSTFAYNDLKSEKNKKSIPEVTAYTEYLDDPTSILASWNDGRILAEAQNLARRLMEAPANVMTPTQFAKVAVELQSKLNNVEIIVREEEWVKEKGMNSFASVSAGSREPLKFLEVHYRGGNSDEAPLALVGKGITFDSGGISIKPSASMDKMRADMGGAACTLASIVAISHFKFQMNVSGFIPLCENMPGGNATKPGDVVKAMNGKTIQIDNTDAEGRLILADALCYAETFKPKAIVDMATLTGAMGVALGSAASGVFTNSDVLWQTLYKAGAQTGDRMWRMPLYQHYARKMTERCLADVNNIGTGGRMAGACTAAGFLKEFVTSQHWAHIDIAGVMESEGEPSYLPKGMSGRPVRTIVEFAKLLSMEKI